jgi:hypothetical protein
VVVHRQTVCEEEKSPKPFMRGSEAAKFFGEYVGEDERQRQRKGN